MESCKNAAQLLNFKKEEIKIVSYREFFANKASMQELVTKSKIVQFDIQEMQESENDISFENGKLLMYKLIIVGTEENINNFKLLFNYQLSEYSRIRKIRDSNPNCSRIFNNWPRNLGSKNSKPFPRKFSDALKS